MNVPRKKILARLGAAVAICALAFCLRWYFGNLPIAYHNRSIERAMESATRIDIIPIAVEFNPDGSMQGNFRIISVTGKKEIAELLGRFKLPWHMTASGRFHECGGHIGMMIVMPDAPDFEIHYDHGDGIYPIATEGNRPGFSKLSVEDCYFLNRYLNGLGFTDRELGMSHR
jgi:hypothetical protein